MCQVLVIFYFLLLFLLVKESVSVLGRSEPCIFLDFWQFASIPCSVAVRSFNTCRVFCFLALAEITVQIEDESSTWRYHTILDLLVLPQALNQRWSRGVSGVVQSTRQKPICALEGHWLQACSRTWPSTRMQGWERDGHDSIVAPVFRFWTVVMEYHNLNSLTAHTSSSMG